MNGCPTITRSYRITDCHLFFIYRPESSPKDFGGWGGKGGMRGLSPLELRFLFKIWTKYDVISTNNFIDRCDLKIRYCDPKIEMFY